MARTDLFRVLGALSSQPWAIRADALDYMVGLADRADAATIESLRARFVAQSSTPVERDALAARMDQNRIDLLGTYDVSGVRVIPVVGPLMRYSSWLELCGMTSYARVAHAFSTALADGAARDIVLDIDSPGGEVTGCSELAAMIRDARGEKNIVAYVGGTCCSAAYWLASACDTIIVESTAVVGSLGCCGTIRDTRPAMEKAGIKSYEIISTQTPGKRPDVATDEGRAAIQAMIDATADVFLNDVAANRGITREKVDSDFGKGGVFVGRQAVAAGMADDVGTLEQVIADLQAQALADATGTANLFATV